MVNSIINEGIDTINKVFGNNQVDIEVNTELLIQLFNKWSQGGLSPHIGMLAVYSIGRIDGIRQERQMRQIRQISHAR